MRSPRWDEPIPAPPPSDNAMITDIFAAVPPGERQHEPGEDCWCRPAVTVLRSEISNHRGHWHWRRHVVIDHRALARRSVIEGIEREQSADLRPHPPLRTGRRASNWSNIDG